MSNGTAIHDLMTPSPWTSSNCPAISNRHVRNDQGFVPLDELAGGIVRSRHAVAMPEQFVEIRITLAADDHELVAFQLLDAGTSIGHHLAQLRQDEIEYFGSPTCSRASGRRTQCLGLFAGFALGLEQPGILDRRRSLSSECGRELRELFVVDVGLELVDAQDTDDAVADDHRGTDPSADSSTPVDVARESAGSRIRRRRSVAASIARHGC